MVDPSEAGSDSAATATFTVTYKVPEELQVVFARELGGAAIFIPTVDQRPIGERARVVFNLAFNDSQITLEGEIVAALPAPIARAGADPGVSIQLDESPSELHRRFEEASGVELTPCDVEQPVAPERTEPRFPASAPVSIEIDGRNFSAETGDISYNGMLALFPQIDLGVESELHLQIEHPGTGEKIELDGHIANQTQCDHGVTAVGIQFRYGLERFDEVSHFVDDLRSFHHARSLATVTGSLANTALESVLETFASASSAGTLKLTRGDEHGKITYQDGEILFATVGLVSGVKALGRLFTWVDAQFEFRSQIEPMEGAACHLPLAPAILAAAVERDELARFDLSMLDPDSTFTVDTDRLDAVASTLDEIGVSLSEHAQIGFPLGAMLDMLTSSDAQIYKGIYDLIEAGVLRVENG